MREGRREGGREGERNFRINYGECEAGLWRTVCIV